MMRSIFAHACDWPRLVHTHPNGGYPGGGGEYQLVRETNPTIPLHESRLAAPAGSRRLPCPGDHRADVGPLPEPLEGDAACVRTSPGPRVDRWPGGLAANPCG
jgi:hypothetical protein